MKKLLLVVISFTLLTLFITACSVEDKKNKDTKTTSNSTEKYEGSDTNQTVLLETTLGNIKIELFNETMPITAGNFEKLVRDGYYDGIIFHRIIDEFMVQGGDPTGTGSGGPGYTIKDEFTKNNKNDRGTLSMANAGANTGGSQFFINLVNNNYLDSKHPVFGKVIEGMEVVDKMAKVDTDAMDRPIEDVKINKATIVE